MARTSAARNHVPQVELPARTFKLLFASESDADEWVQTIQRAYHQQPHTDTSAANGAAPLQLGQIPIANKPQGAAAQCLPGGPDTAQTPCPCPPSFAAGT